MKASHSEQAFEMFELMSQGIWQIDAAGRTSYVNSRMAAMLGYSREELLALRALTFVREEDRERVGARIAARSRGVRDNYECQLAHKDGSWVSVIVETIQLYRDDGESDGALALLTDITGRKRAEEALAATLAQLTGIMEGARNAIAMMDTEHRYVRFNSTFHDEFKQVFGVDLKPGDSMLQALAHRPEELAPALACWDRALGGEDFSITRPFGDAALEPQWYELHFSPVRDAQGAIVGAANIVRNITDHKRADEIQAAALDRLQKIAARVPGLVYQYRLRADGSSCFPYASDAIHQIYRVSPEEVREDASAVFSRLHPDDLERVRASIQASARELTPWNCEYRTSFDDGTVRWLLGNAVPEREADGAVLWHGFITDITERKQLDASLARQDRLASMGMVAAGVGHEVNNPLAYVIFNLESLADELPKLAEAARRCSGGQAAPGVSGTGCLVLRHSAFSEAIEGAREALEGSLRIKDITKRLGSFGRIDHGELGLVDLNHAFDGAIGMAHNEIKYRARLSKQLGPVPLVWATEGKLIQVLLNLLINAVHATDEGGAERNTITVRTWAEGGDVLAEVADTGHGIPPENLERIFEPFFTTKPVGSGSGLGLAICRNLVSEFGGDISAHSEPGKGARFVVRLPVRSSVDSEHRPAAASHAPEALNAIRGRVLIVDDEPSLTRLLTRLLGADHDVLVADSGKEALTLLEKDRAFDLVLCDLMMADVSGVDLHAWLAQTDPALARQVVFMSGGVFVPKVADYLGRVGNLRIAKPFDAAHLKRLVPELVLAARGKRGAART